MTGLVGIRGYMRCTSISLANNIDICRSITMLSGQPSTLRPITSPYDPAQPVFCVSRRLPDSYDNVMCYVTYTNMPLTLTNAKDRFLLGHII